MNGELAQVIALATHGTLWLRTSETADQPPLQSGNSTFQYVKSIEFSAGDAPPLSSVAEWLLDRRATGLTRLWLDVPDALRPRPRWPNLESHIEVAFSNGGRWRLLATGPGPGEFWLPTWTVGPLDAPDRRIWSVRYERADAQRAQPVRPEVIAARSALERALIDARDFANRIREEFWASLFEAALKVDAPPEYHPDMVPDEFPTQAGALVGMASRAWVFGGMGSWNDLYFEDGAQRAEHREVSRLLFANLIQGCVAAVNCPLSGDRA